MLLFMCVVSLCILFFFFFNQQTAYEMRISDWSSDVCSSDLTGAGQAKAWKSLLDVAGAGHVAHGGGLRLCKRIFHGGLTGNHSGEQLPEIGRASCSDRVCKYV